MAKKKEEGYLTRQEVRQISRYNKKVTDELEKKHKRKNVPESEYMTTMRDPANEVEFDNVHTYFFTDAGTVKSVNGVSFDIPKGKTVGVVGESGCGKSVTSLSLMRLVQRPQGQTVEGAIRLNIGDGKAIDVTQAPDEVMEKIRGNKVSMIFQEPMTALNPIFRIGDQVDEVIELHDGAGKSKEDIKRRTIELLNMVGIANSEGVYSMYPHELSGGMRQRVMIAMALACNPQMIIADEPTTALDVTIQAQILDLLRNLKDKINASIMFITHDLGVIAEMADYVVVMYAGSSTPSPARSRTPSTCRITATSRTGVIRPSLPATASTPAWCSSVIPISSPATDSTIRERFLTIRKETSDGRRRELF